MRFVHRPSSVALSITGMAALLTASSAVYSEYICEPDPKAAPYESTCILTETWGFPLHFVVDSRTSGSLGSLDPRDRVYGGRAFVCWLFFAFSLAMVYVAARLVIFIVRQRTERSPHPTRPVVIRTGEALAFVALGMSIGLVLDTWIIFLSSKELATWLPGTLFPYTASMAPVERPVVDLLQYPAYGLLLGACDLVRGRLWPAGAVLCMCHALGILFALVAWWNVLDPRRTVVVVAETV